MPIVIRKPPPDPPKRIYKYPLQVTDKQEIELPLTATVLSVQADGDKLFFWALVDINEKTKPRVFRVIGTGHDIPDFKFLHYLGTVQTHGGSLVWHVCESYEHRLDQKESV